MRNSIKQMFVAGIAAMALSGCAANSSAPVLVSTQVASPKSHAECLVCKKSADLACIDVDVDAKTPWLDYIGKRYYFCSDECRSEFQKSPAKFVNTK